MIVTGIAEWCLPARGPEAISIAGQLGLQAIHLGFQTGGNGRPMGEAPYMEACSSKAQELGILIAALAMNAIEGIGGISYPDAHKKAECINLIKRGIDAAASVEIPLVYVPSFGLMEIRTEPEFHETVQILKEACAYAENKGVLLASENTLGPEDSVSLAHKVSQPNFRILVDTLNPIMWGHNTAEIVSAVRPYLCNQIHAKDCSDSFASVPLGRGIGRFSETACNLLANGFDGIVIIENNYERSVEANIRADIANVKKYFDSNSLNQD